jgi:hypothetical protein
LVAAGNSGRHPDGKFGSRSPVVYRVAHRIQIEELTHQTVELESGLVFSEIRIIPAAIRRKELRSVDDFIDDCRHMVLPAPVISATRSKKHFPTPMLLSHKQFSLLWRFEDFFHPSDNAVCQANLNAMRMCDRLRKNILNDPLCQFAAALVLFPDHPDLGSRFDIRPNFTIHFWLLPETSLGLLGSLIIFLATYHL